MVRISRNREKPYSDRIHNNNNNRSDTLSWCQISGKNSRNRRENLTVIKLMQNNNNNNAGKFKEEFTHTQSISRGFSRGLCEYSDFFQDHQLRPQHIGDVRRDYIHFVDSNWDLKAVVLIQVNYDQYKSFRATELQELQSFEPRGTKIQNTVKVN